MLFSTKAEYGIRAMVELARRGSETPVSLAEIADHEHLPLSYLEHLVARLRRAGLIESKRGAHGGYLLARPANEITMAEIVDALEGGVAPIECISDSSAPVEDDPHGRGCPGFTPDSEGTLCVRHHESDHVCPTKLLWTRVQAAVLDTLTTTNLSDLVHEKQRPVVAA